MALLIQTNAANLTSQLNFQLMTSSLNSTSNQPSGGMAIGNSANDAAAAALAAAYPTSAPTSQPPSTSILQPAVLKPLISGSVPAASTKMTALLNTLNLGGASQSSGPTLKLLA